MLSIRPMQNLCDPCIKVAPPPDARTCPVFHLLKSRVFHTITAVMIRKQTHECRISLNQSSQSSSKSVRHLMAGVERPEWRFYKYPMGGPPLF